jgi:formylmethanofuran dehydrogenase subunit E
MPPSKPRASKVRTKWIPKTVREDVKLPKAKLEMRKYSPSKHPMVKFIKRVEKEEEDRDMRDAMIAGFQAEHCGNGNFSGREIAAIRLPNGKIRRAYACDVCGYVGFKETAT